jgi:hypothetical protein
MSAPKSKLVTLEVGSSWTRAFLIDHEKGNKLKIENQDFLPTSSGDLRFTVDILLKKLGVEPKENTLLFTSSLDEVKALSDEFKGIFIPSSEVQKNLLHYLKGAGYPACTILDAGVGLFFESPKATEVGRYLSFAIGEVELENHLANHTLHPQTIPETTWEGEINEALSRVVFAKKASSFGAANNILVTGSLIAAHPKLSRIALVVLDILGPNMIADVVVDKYSFSNCWGAAITKYRELVDFEIGYLEKLGSLVSLGGAGRVGLDYGLKHTQEVKVVENEIALIPATAEQKVEVELGIGKEKRRFQTAGGSFGVLIDGRQKPLPLVFGQSASQKAMIKWAEAIEKVEIIQ